MYKSYYFLNRYIIELRLKLDNKTITDIFSQEKDKLIFQLQNIDDIFLEISVNPSKPYLNLRNKFSRARKNTIDFFPQISGAVINDILIASDDRIILLSTSKGEIYFAIRGQHTNVFFVSKMNIKFFKKESDENLKKYLSEFSEKKYLHFFNSIDKKVLVGKPIEQIRKEFPYVGKEIANEVKLRADQNNDNGEVLIEVLKIIENNKPVIFKDEVSGTIQIGFDQLKIFAGMNKEYFNDLITAFNQYISKKYYQDERLSKHKIIKSFLDKELKKVTDKLNNLHSVIEKGSNETELNKFANLLLINLDKIKSGKEQIELIDIYGNAENISIKLNPKLSPNQNAKRYFEKARDNRISYEKSLKLKRETEKYFDKLKLVETKLINANTLNDLELIMDELKIKNVKNEKGNEELSSKFKHYFIEKKFHVFVGKDGANNDLLTTKFAKQNDFWFHARSVSGSHLILRVDNAKEAIPKNVLKKAASLAAYHSKAKTSKLAPVSYTLKKYVIKRKGMPVGQVSLIKEEVLLVKPEIPTDCEYISIDNIL
jgi:predicted ribosome quality control (RQC) complex YloA/Tae2 family protein